MFSNQSVTFTSNCSLCDKPDVAEEMVQCEECKTFLHLSCAAVDESVLNTEWMCHSCLNSAKEVQNAADQEIQALSKRLTELLVSFPSKSTSNLEPTRELASHLARLMPTNPVGVLPPVTSPPSTIATQPSQLPSHQINVTESASSSASWPQEANSSTYSHTPLQSTVSSITQTSTGTIRKVPTRPPRGTGFRAPVPIVRTLPSTLSADAQIFRSDRSSSMPQLRGYGSSSSLTESQLRNWRKADILARMRQVCEEEKRLMEQFEYEDQASFDWSSPPQSIFAPSHLVSSSIDSLRSTSMYSIANASTRSSWLNSYTRTVPSVSQPIPSTVALNAPYPVNATFNVPVTNSTFNQSQSLDYSMMNMQRMMARQSIKVELPEFHGKPEEWAMFITSFESTTQACGYTDVENLYRLQKCLKGSARTMVEGLLSNPSFVGQIISTLRTLYGRPDMIINSQIERIRKEPPPKADRLETIVQFSVLVKNLCATIESSGLREHMSNPLLLQELVNRLPAQMKINWAQYRRMFTGTDIKVFSLWLDQTAVDICSVLPHAVDMHKSNSFEKPKRGNDAHINLHDETPTQHNRESSSYVQKKESSSTQQNKESSSTAPRRENSTSQQNKESSNVQRNKCEFCDKSSDICKSLTTCTGFTKLALSERWNTVRRLKLCCVCLKPHKGKCSFSKECGINRCEKKHHQVLHNPNKPVEKCPEKAAVESAVVGLHHNASNTIFRIIPVTLRGPKGSADTYALLDDAAKITIMESSLAKDLGVVGKPAPLRLKWTGDAFRYHDESEVVNLKISPRSSEKTFDLRARTVYDVGLPRQSVDMKELKNKHSFLSKLPVQSYKDIQPKLLIGLDHMSLSVPRKVIEGTENEPIGTKTLLGWCVGGRISTESNQSALNSVLFHSCECQSTEDSRLEELVRSYYAVESIGITKKLEYTLTPEDKRAYAIMEETTVKRGDRFEVGLLWKYESILLPNSYAMAMSRLRCFEKKLSVDPALKLEVQEQFRQYINEGYMRLLSPQELLADYPYVWYLPVFAVRNPNKLNSTRLVFDAAAVVDGISLNHVLLTGPDINASLLHILFRFREGKYAFTADIQKMFHRVLVRGIDQHAQRVLWRDGDSTKTPQTYAMCVMTFGATCSPFQAQYIKNKNADQFQARYPEAVKSIKESHYVDDLLESVDNLEYAITLARDIKQIHAAGGFNIRNWRSNASEITDAMNESTPNTTPISIMSPEGSLEKVLGIFWDTESDCVTYSLRHHKSSKDIIDGSRRPTKRESLRTQMSTYDPPGYLAHFLVGLKIIQRETWIQNLGWDDTLTDDLFEKWQRWLKHLPSIEDLKIPRHYMKGVTTKGICDLHVFVDAGEKAFSAVVYLRMETPNEVVVSLVAAKSKTAPVKITAIPRLELQSAVLGNRLAITVKSALRINIRRIHYWTDSTTVLDWLNTKKRLVQFVAFRIGEIRENSSVNDWRWVPTHENVADEATKFSDSFKLDYDSRWFQGPAFLQQDSNQWPTDSRKDQPEDDIPEILLHQELKPPLIDFQRFSKFRKLLRTAAYVYRYVYNRMARYRKVPIQKLPLTANELANAEALLFREAQSAYFMEEILTLMKGQQLSRKSVLYKRSPFLDANNVIRMKSRTELFTQSGTEKHPIILPRQHRVTELLIEEIHQRHAHQFNETVVNEVRQRFDIIGLRRLVKKVRRDCVQCKINNATPNIPEMAPLPPARLAINFRPFTYTGVDFFGPLTVTVRRRPEKRWGVIFTCLTLRAVHIELTSSLSTDSFILCLRNFTNRRGEPREIYCDRGTNFVGAEKVLKDVLVGIDFDQVVDSTTNPNLQWKFNPPASPHMGGAWERLIRSIKSALKVMFPPERNPNPDVLLSALIEIEGMLNARPLTYMPLDSESDEALTPNHFLLGDSKGRKILFQNRTIEPKVLKFQWQLQQQMVRRFRRRWILEYLPTLTRRSKWFTDVPEIKDGDLVIIIDENDKKQSWPKGKILQVVKSPDGKVRRAFVQTAVNGDKKVYERPVSKLALLDVA